MSFHSLKAVIEANAGGCCELIGSEKVDLADKLPSKAVYQSDFVTLLHLLSHPRKITKLVAAVSDFC